MSVRTLIKQAFEDVCDKERAAKAHLDKMMYAHMAMGDIPTAIPAAVSAYRMASAVKSRMAEYLGVTTEDQLNQYLNRQYNLGADLYLEMEKLLARLLGDNPPSAALVDSYTVDYCSLWEVATILGNIRDSLPTKQNEDEARENRVK